MILLYGVLQIKNVVKKNPEIYSWIETDEIDHVKVYLVKNLLKVFMI